MLLHSDKSWRIFLGSNEPHSGIDQLPEPPHWRRFFSEEIVAPPDDDLERLTHKLGVHGRTFRSNAAIIDAVNTALYLRRPLLVTGRPGTGKSSLAYVVAHELNLGEVLEWPITTRSTFQDALYRYDAIARLQDSHIAPSEQIASKGSTSIGEYIRLGPVGTAFLPYAKPRVLLIDEIDKSDIDLPNDLLNLFESGWYEVPELVRIAGLMPSVSVSTAYAGHKVDIRQGRVACRAFPFVVITSNGERELPGPILRRCIRLELTPPSAQELASIVEAHFGQAEGADSLFRQRLIAEFCERRDGGHVATDQLLNAIYLLGHAGTAGRLDEIRDLVLRRV